MTALRLLQVEDVEGDAALVVRALRRAGHEVEARRVDTPQALREALAEPGWDVVISDYDLPQFDARTALALLHESGQDLPFIVVSGTIGEDVAVAMMRLGAHDYLMKGNLQRLGPAVAREVAEARVRRQRVQLEADVRRISAAEQQRLGMELHDGLGQELTGIALLLEALATRARLERLALADDVAALAALASRAVATARSIAHGLLPVGDSADGLLRALRALVEATGSAHAITATLQAEGVAGCALPAHAPHQLYRIAQEAITNSLRHARATRVDVALRREAAHDRLQLSISDDGRGFDPVLAGERPGIGGLDAAARGADRDASGRGGGPGRGLDIMPTRARMLGGELRIERLEAGGTRVTCTCPLPPAR
jgi:signal transduction histidine kinase